jgi:hypothetical protein
MSFGYVVLLNVFHILTRWIFYISLSLRDIASRKIIEEIPFSGKSQSSTILSFIHRWIGLAFRYVVHQDVLSIINGKDQKQTLRLKIILPEQ